MIETANGKSGAAGFNNLYDIVKKLRSPGGCPWDSKQTADSLKESLIEEAYECFDAIVENDVPHICEELGDIYLLATFIAIIFEEESAFDCKEIFDGICEKLIRRHPHVFADSEADTAEKVLHQWDEIKNKVEGRDKDDSVLDSVPKHFPPLLKAAKLQKKAAKNNFDWDKIDDVFEKLDEESAELKAAVAEGDIGHIEEEIGDLLFTVVNIARKLDIDPSTALTGTNNKFSARFRYIEKSIKKKGRKLTDSSLEELDALWNEAKNNQL